MTDISETVRRFVLENVVSEEESESITNEQNLSDAGILDSLSTLSLISFIENVFGITLEPEDIDEGNFSSIANIGRFIESKLERGSSQIGCLDHGSPQAQLK